MTGNAPERKPAPPMRFGENMEASAPNSLRKNVIVRFVDWIKPYKEFVAIAGSAVILLSGGVSWAVSRFATVDQLSNLECRILINISTESLPIVSKMLNMKIESKWAQIANLPKDNTPELEAKKEQMKQDIKDLSDERRKVDAALEQEIRGAPVKCVKK